MGVGWGGGACLALREGYADTNKVVMWVVCRALRNRVDSNRVGDVARVGVGGGGIRGLTTTGGRVMEGVDLCSYNGTSRCVGERCLKNIK